MNQEPKDTPKGSSTTWGGLIWWMMLVFAVLLFPLFASVIALAITNSPLGQMIVFVLACWGCTWAGMWLMKKTK